MRFPVQHKEVREMYVCCRDECPECGGALDTGWECNDCGYDARTIIVESPEWDVEK